MNQIRRWQDYSRQYGPTGLVKHLIARLLRPVWEQASIEIFLRQPPAKVVVAKVPMRVIILTPSVAKELPWYSPDWERRWGRGEVCYSGWIGNNCVHFSWVSRVDSYLGEVHQWIELGQEDAYIYDCFTDGGYRGQAIFPAVLSTIAEGLFSEGVRRIWIAAEANNRSSTRAIQRAGFDLIATASYRRVGLVETRSVSDAGRVRLKPN